MKFSTSLLAGGILALASASPMIEVRSGDLSSRGKNSYLSQFQKKTKNKLLTPRSCHPFSHSTYQHEARSSVCRCILLPREQ